MAQAVVASSSGLSQPRREFVREGLRASRKASPFRPRAQRSPAYLQCRAAVSPLRISLSATLRLRLSFIALGSEEFKDGAHQTRHCRGYIRKYSGSLFKKEADLKPHQSRYWLHAQYEDEAEFVEQTQVICQLYGQAQTLEQQGVHLVSSDEKTGIQALERLYGATRPMQRGSVEKHEFEYKRHGTVCLLVNWLVGEGKIVAPTVSATRTEKDYATHIENTIASDAAAGWIFIHDQLNTHYSASLVRLVTKHCEFEGDLGVKGKSGILHNAASRKQFLQDPTHRIRFVFTPKHCSWINQVEPWFSILQRKLLKRASFACLDELKDKLLAFIDFFNEYLAKPFQWQYKGKILKI